MTPAQRIAAGRKGGTQAGITRRRKAVERVVGKVGQLVPATLREELTRAGLLRWQAVLARAYRQGRADERSRLRMALPEMDRRRRRKDVAA